jgi:plasmid stabilization system protein ParE
MSGYQFTPQALGDLLDIWSFIARDNSEAANRVEAAILRACGLLAASPLAGQVRTDLSPLPLRFWVVQPYSNYLIVYDPEAKPLQVIRILHGARDISSLVR